MADDDARTRSAGDLDGVRQGGEIVIVLHARVNGDDTAVLPCDGRQGENLVQRSAGRITHAQGDAGCALAKPLARQAAHVIDLFLCGRGVDVAGADHLAQGGAAQQLRMVERIPLVDAVKELGDIGNGQAAVSADQRGHALQEGELGAGFVIRVGGHIVHMGVHINKPGANDMPSGVKLGVCMERGIGNLRNAAVLYDHRGQAGGAGLGIDDQPVVDAKRIHLVCVLLTICQWEEKKTEER